MGYGRQKKSKPSSHQPARKPMPRASRLHVRDRRLTVEYLEPRLSLSGVPQFSGMVVFGDSLSDTGNVPSSVAAIEGYEETDGCFTSPLGAAPPYQAPVVWHQELATQLGIPEATPAKFGGSNWATGGATTGNGYEVGPVVNLTNYPYGYPNLGQQVSDYVSTTAAGPSNALFAVWAGANDLLNAADAAEKAGGAAAPHQFDLTAKIAVTNLDTDIQALVQHGARCIIWPNLPALNLTPHALGFEGNPKDYPGYSQQVETALTNAVSLFNSQWQSAISQLR